jgi:RNA polymerase sigma factor (TIGR02999 family)
LRPGDADHPLRAARQRRQTVAMVKPSDTPPIAADGDRAVEGARADLVFAQLYDQLRALARTRLASSRLTLLDATSLVHECYLRCAQLGVPSGEQGRFLAYASRVMRSVIVDVARRRRTERRGGGAVHAELDTAIAESAVAPEDRLLKVAEALEELAQVDPRLAQVVEMRYFAGFSEAEIGLALGVTERTVRRDWQRARLLLSAVIDLRG